MVISSPELTAHWWAYSIGRYLPSVVNIFKHLLLRSDCSNWSQILCGAFMGWGIEDSIKLSCMPIYGKNLKKYSSLEPNSRWSWNLVCSIKYSSTTKFFQMMTLGWPWPQGQIWSLMLFIWEKIKTMDFLETIVVYAIKVGRWNLLNEYMKLYEYQRSRSFTDLCPSHSDLMFSFPQ